MKTNRLPSISIRYARIEDEMMLLEWANDLIVRQNSLNSGVIGATDHHKWFISRLNNRLECKIFIAETSAGVPFGQVRLEKKNLDWEIDYSVNNAFRGRNLGLAILRLALEKCRHEVASSRFLGVVKRDNSPSINIFKNLGFTLELKGNFFICRSS